MGDEAGSGAVARDPGVAAAFAAMAARCRSRAYLEEGIPAMLVLEDLRDARTGPGGRKGDGDLDAVLAAALELYGELVRDGVAEPGAREIATALEVLAARFFLAGAAPHEAG